MRRELRLIWASVWIVGGAGADDLWFGLAAVLFGVILGISVFWIKDDG